MHKIIYSGEHEIRTDLWVLHIQREDGAKGVHMMPKFILDLRAAEYGVDPTDVDTLISMVVHEPYMPVEEATAENPTPIAHLLQVDSTVAAREAHLARIKNCPVQFEIKGSKGLDTLRKQHKPDLDRIKAHRELVDTHRWSLKYGDIPMPPRFAPKTTRAMPFVLTGMKESGANPLPDSMINDGSFTISVKGSNG
jgi:hypothetical protein